MNMLEVIIRCECVGFLYDYSVGDGIVLDCRIGLTRYRNLNCLGWWVGGVSCKRRWKNFVCRTRLLFDGLCIVYCAVIDSIIVDYTHEIWT